MPSSCSRAFPRARSRLLAALFATSLVAACGDLPTDAESYVREAGGAVWVAIAEPEGLPDAKSWLPYLPDDAPATLEVKRLKSEAAKARRAGRAEAFLALDAEAARKAAAALPHAPPPEAVLEGMAALESWVQRAEGRRQTGRFPALDSALVLVRARRDAAGALLAQGDTVSAAAEMTSAAEAARHLSPVAVGLRAVRAAEARIEGEPNPTEELRRARRLLRSAREALATGDYPRAMQRALYACQLIDAFDRVPPSAGRGRARRGGS